MENSKSYQIRIGLFVTAGLVAVMISILSLGGNKMLFDDQVSLKVIFKEVQGLNKGSVVSLSGLIVGNVEEIGFSEKNTELGLIVHMKISAKHLVRITKGSYAEVKTQGALGDKYIYITPGDSLSEKVKDGDFLDSKESGDLLALLSEKGGEAVKVFDLISELNFLLKTINKESRIEKILVNLVDASQNFKKLSTEGQKFISDLSQENPAKIKAIVIKLDSILSKIDKGEGSLGALINDPSVHEQLKGVLGGGVSRKKYMKSLIRTSIEKGED